MTKFETKTCSRCGGSGSYSWCARHGSTCFGCHGTGARLTNRGALAYAMFESLLKVAAKTIVVGDKAQYTSVTNGCDVYTKFGKVVEVWTGKAKDSGAYRVGGEDEDAIVLVFADGMRWHTSPDEMVRKWYTADEKAPMLAQALAYQATLTKTGAVRA